MKKIVSVILAVLLLSVCAFAEGGQLPWYVLEGNVLTVRVPTDIAADESWGFEISDPAAIELITNEYAEDQEGYGDIYAASFTNFTPKATNATIALCHYNEAGTLMEVRRIHIAVDEAGQITINSDEIISVDDDFSVFYNPVGYDLFQITDIYSPDGTILCVQGTFGMIDPVPGEYSMNYLGFDLGKTMTISLAEGCTFMVPASLEDLDTNVALEDIGAWYEDCCELLGFPYTFHAALTMDTNGAVTALEYVYVP